jgi:hypothetical protein
MPPIVFAQSSFVKTGRGALMTDRREEKNHRPSVSAVFVENLRASRRLPVSLSVAMKPQLFRPNRN